MLDPGPRVLSSIWRTGLSRTRPGGCRGGAVPIGEEEINRKKAHRRRKARIDARTRERLPALPALARSLDQRRNSAHALLEGARGTPSGKLVSFPGATVTRCKVDRRTSAERVWVEDPATGKRRDLTREEDHAFWAWAIVEVLRATGIRVEELTELNHYGLVQYRLPETGELVPLLQIAPSKTDAERLLVVSPDLADVLATIISRVRERSRGGAAGQRLRHPRAHLVPTCPVPVPAQHRRGEPGDPDRRHRQTPHPVACRVRPA